MSLMYPGIDPASEPTVDLWQEEGCTTCELPLAESDLNDYCTCPDDEVGEAVLMIFIKCPACDRTMTEHHYETEHGDECDPKLDCDF
jgi:hypothetical protein